MMRLGILMAMVSIDGNLELASKREGVQEANKVRQFMTANHRNGEAISRFDNAEMATFDV